MGDFTRAADFDSITILIDDVPHLSFKRASYVGFQSWKQGAAFCVELAFESGGSILAEYDSEAKWRRVIDLLGLTA